MLRRGHKSAALLALGVFFLAALTACSGSPTPTPTSTPFHLEALIVPTPTTDAGQPTELNVVLATTDLAVGENRVAFAVLGADGGLVSQGDVYASFSQEGSPDGFEVESRANFRQWPSGRGLYTVQARFGAPGLWRMDVDTEVGGQIARGSAEFQVSLVSGSPAVGAPAPASRNKTLRDVERIEELTTDGMPDKELYSMTIAEALEAGNPLVVTFATPAFCRTATCGPQLEALKEVKAQYPERVVFIHVEVFDNPLEMREDYTSARVASAVEEWGLKTEPFTFVIDSAGLVSAKFEGFVTAEELSESVEKTLS